MASLAVALTVPHPAADSSPEEVSTALQLAGTQLQTLRVQAPHLTRLQSAMPERFEPADREVGLIYADTSQGGRPTRQRIAEPERDLRAEIAAARRQLARAQRQHAATEARVGELEAAKQPAEEQELAALRSKLAAQAEAALSKAAALARLEEEGREALRQEGEAAAADAAAAVAALGQHQTAEASERATLEELWAAELERGGGDMGGSAGEGDDAEAARRRWLRAKQGARRGKARRAKAPRRR